MFLKLKKLTGLSDKNLDCMKVAVDVNKLTYKQASTDLSIQQFRLSDNYTYSMTMTKAWTGCSIRSLVSSEQLIYQATNSKERFQYLFGTQLNVLYLKMITVDK